MKSTTLHKPLYLTQEEALTLLDMFLLSNAGESATQHRVLSHLSDLCREFIRAEESGQQLLSLLARRSPLQKTRDASCLSCV